MPKNKYDEEKCFKYTFEEDEVDSAQSEELPTFEYRKSVKNKKFIKHREKNKIENEEWYIKEKLSLENIFLNKNIENECITFDNNEEAIDESFDICEDSVIYEAEDNVIESDKSGTEDEGYQKETFTILKMSDKPVNDFLDLNNIIIDEDKIYSKNNSDKEETECEAEDQSVTEQNSQHLGQLTEDNVKEMLRRLNIVEKELENDDNVTENEDEELKSEENKNFEVEEEKEHLIDEESAESDDEIQKAILTERINSLAETIARLKAELTEAKLIVENEKKSIILPGHVCTIANPCTVASQLEERLRARREAAAASYCQGLQQVEKMVSQEMFRLEEEMNKLQPLNRLAADWELSPQDPQMRSIMYKHDYMLVASEMNLNIPRQLRSFLNSDIIELNEISSAI